MYISTQRVYKEKDFFYKDWSYFRWHIRPTIIDWRRNMSQYWLYKYNGCPKTPKKIFREDYKAFYERWWKQEVYLKVNWNYDSHFSVWQCQVVIPVYELEWGKIKTIFNNYRWRYPLWLFDVTKIERLPRDTDGEIEPNEKFIDVAGIAWRDSNMFVALGWAKAKRELDNKDSSSDIASITWAWYPIANDYNLWYKYDNWQLIAVVDETANQP